MSTYIKHRTSGPLLIAVVLAAGFVAPTALSAARITNPDYVGKGRFDRNMKVEFRIYERHGRRHVKFQASNVKFFCNDNTEQDRRDLKILPAPLARNKFERVAWGSGEGEAIYWFKGRLSKDGRRAKGFVRASINPSQVQEDAGVPECTTFGPRSWVAKRVN